MEKVGDEGGQRARGQEGGREGGGGPSQAGGRVGRRTSPGARPHRLPTFRRKWTVQWMPAHGRWMTQSERLVCMGFPSTEPLARVYGLGGKFQLPWACRNLLGNSMHVACMGVWQACVAACVVVAPAS